METQTKWISKYNISDKVRHIISNESGIVTAVLFKMDFIRPLYTVTNGSDDYYWTESEIIRSY